LNNLPLVTISIPTYNRISLLKRCLNSILIQDYKNIEICISDNASSDGTSNYIESLKDSRIKINVNNINHGMVSNWDKCLSMSSGKYFLLMSDDDALATAQAISKFVEAFEQSDSNEISFVFSSVYIESSNGSLSEHLEERGYCDYSLQSLIQLFYKNKISIFPCATFMRRKDLIDLNGYSSFGAILGVDACMWISISTKYSKIRHIPTQLAIYRNHQSLSSSSVEVWNADFNIVKNLLKNKTSKKEYIATIKSIETAIKRLPLSYILRQIKYNSEYDFKKLLKDFKKYGKDLFIMSNILFLLKLCLRKLLNIKF
jgi:glycosyltransferase involved in cell wall biosynthesis